MFSDNEVAARQRNIAVKLTALTSDEIETMQEIVKYIQSGNENREEYSLAMVNPEHEWYLYLDTIFRFYVNCEYDNHDIFKKFLEDDSMPHVAALAAKVKKSGYPDCNIPSVDKSEPISIVAQAIIAHLETRVDVDEKDSPEEDKRFLSDQACNLGSKTMLQRRCRSNVEKLKKSFADTFAVGQFFNDIRRLGNLYGTYGYLTAAIFLWDLGNHHENHREDKEDKNLTIAAYKMAADYLFRAKILFEDKDNTLNQNLLKLMTGSEGLLFFVSRPESATYIKPSELEGLSPDEVNAKIYEKFQTTFLARLDGEVLQKQYEKASTKLYSPVSDESDLLLSLN